MKKTYLAFVVTVLAITPVVGFADDMDGTTEITSSVELGIRSVDDQDGSAKFQEYRDLDDGLFGDFYIEAVKDFCYFEVEVNNIGLDDQEYQLEGGHYGQFKYELNYDETPHNLSFDAKTFHSGVGSNNLSFTGTTPPDEADWNYIDYYVDRKKYGVGGEVSMKSPFYVNFGVSRLEMDGQRPLGSGGFAGVAEMPEPVEYNTDDVTVQAGYQSKTLTISLSGMLSSFENENLYLNWKNPFSAETEINTLPPENDYGKLKANLAWRQLPLMSTFSLSGSYSKLENDFSLSDLNLTAADGLNSSTFDGEVTYSTISSAFVSRPTRKLDTRIYYRYRNKDNDSDVISDAEGSNEEHLFDYTKHNAGLDLGYRLPERTKLKLGYEFLDIDRRNRPDAESNTDHTLYIQLKNTSWDFLTSKLKYSRLERDADPDLDLTGVDITDAEYIEQFLQRFDYTDKSQDEVKLTLEFYPLDHLDFGLEYRYAQNDYDDVILGRSEDQRNEVYGDFAWRPGGKFMVNGFAGYEMCESDSNHYNYRAGFGSPAQTSDPTVEDGNPDSYLWTQDSDDDFWTYGFAVQGPIMEDKLDFALSWEYQESDGESNFTSNGDELTDIDEFDDYKKSLLEAKAIYAFAEKLDMVIGYIYEKYEYEDLQYEGYELQPSSTLLTGAYADHDYEVNIGYLLVRYGF